MSQSCASWSIVGGTYIGLDFSFKSQIVADEMLLPQHVLMIDYVPLSVMSATWNMCLQEELCWRRMQQLQEENITVMGHVVGINKGGLMVDVFDLRGFMPMSHVPSVSKLLWH